MNLSPYQPRPIRFLDLWTVAGWRLKVYGISYNRPHPRPVLVEAARQSVAGRLSGQPTGQQHYNVGFVGIHDGRGENQVFLDLWINENELLHWFQVSPVDDPASLRDAPTDHNSVCVWDLMVQCHERQAWIDCVLANPRGPDLDAYLSRQLNTEA